MTFLDLFRACLVSMIFGSKQVFDKFNQMSRYVWRGKKRSLNLDFDFMVWEGHEPGNFLYLS